MRIFPNPTTGRLTVEALSEKCSAIEVYDLMGNKVYMLQAGNGMPTIDIDLTGLAKGVYLLKILRQEEMHNEVIVLE